MAGGNACEGLDAFVLILSLIYAILVILSTITTTCIGSMLTHFNGQCLLFSDIEENFLNNSRHAITSIKSNPGNCEFTAYTNGAAIFYSLIAASYHFYLLKLSHSNESVLYSMITRPFVAFNCVFGVFGLIIASIISAGFHYVCSKWRNLSFIGTTQCDDLENASFWALSPEVEPKGSILDLKIAQIAIWLATVLWILVFGLSIIKHMQTQRASVTKKYVATLMENSGTELHAPGADDDKDEESVLFDGSFRHVRS